MRTTLGFLLSLAPLAAQTEDFGKGYSFEERKPVSRVEQVVDKFLPSLVKVHGASGLSTKSCACSVASSSSAAGKAASSAGTKSNARGSRNTAPG